MKEKILFVIDSLNSGGAEKSLISMLNIFNYDKYEVDLLMFSPKGLYLTLIPKQVNIVETPYLVRLQQKEIKYLFVNKRFRELYVRLGISFSLRNPFCHHKMHKAQISWKWLSKGLKDLDSKYDIAIAYSQGMPTYYIAEKVKSKKKLCWINTDYKLTPYNKVYDKKYYEYYDNIVAVSDYNKGIFIKEMPIAKEKTTVVYDILSSALINSMAIQPGGFKDNYKGLRILTIGRLVDVKGYDLAIEACYKLKKEGFKFKWYVIGEGYLKDKLVNMIRKLGLEETFILIGTYQNPYNFMKNCDIYVQPSRYEGYGLAIAEARMLNIPVVTTKFDAVYNQMVDEKNGLIVDMDAESVREGILRLINDHELRQNIIEYLHSEKKGNEEEIEKLYQLIG